MKNLNILTATGQLAEFLKDEIRGGRWTDKMPGESRLMSDFQVGRGTVRAAMVQLEEEGVLVSDGQGKRRRIVMIADASTRRKIRVRIFLYEKRDRGDVVSSSLLAGLLDAGMDADFTGKSLKELAMDVDRVARYVKRNPADAWIVSAASREVLEWFAAQPAPALALFGGSARVQIASAFPVMLSGITEAVHRLIGLGHRRIVMLTREEHRKPRLSHPEQVFLNQLEAAGIRTGSYNVPDWEESGKGLKRLIEELFRHSPPTAMIFQEAHLFTVTRLLLADRGISAPRDVSLVVADTDLSFEWCDPIPSHIHWDYRPVVRRMVRWAKNVAAGKEDCRKVGTESKFIEGGTIGPVRGG
jgi:DNA-binding LacI/PurR family transcriptional regulator